MSTLRSVLDKRQDEEQGASTVGAWDWRRAVLRAERSGLWAVVLLLLFLWWYGSLTEQAEVASDEGINFMKALLYSEGYSLHGEIWSDQPPLFTVLLAGWWRLFGMSVTAARVLVALSSCVIVWSLYQLVRRRFGRGGGSSRAGATRGQ